MTVLKWSFIKLQSYKKLPRGSTQIILVFTETILVLNQEDPRDKDTGNNPIVSN